ncbi:MAG: family 78 glycoside hydrolase catalytic domain [Opitutales bacterium]|nr:family 78 glycoside hydrolase catalytic domain [Opitutales bacterium]
MPLFRKEFSLSADVSSAVFTVAVRGLVRVEINGHRLGDDDFVPGWSDYRTRIFYVTYDPARLLAAGDNVVGFILGDGWYCGHVANRDRQVYGDRPSVRAELRVTCADGVRMTVATDTTWRVAEGPWLASDIIMGETVDARREIPGWSRPGGAGAGWTAAVPAPDSSAVLTPFIGEPVRAQEVLPGRIAGPVGTGENRILVDFGQNLTGRVRLRLRGERGACVTLRHGEVLDGAGHLYTDNLRSARATDQYTCKGGGPETYEPLFTFHGFRYVEITGVAQEAIEEVEAVVLHSDFRRTGWFSCSHPMLNQLAQNIRWGLKGNFLDVPTDCPQRDERLGWTGDAQVFAPTAAFFYDVRAFFHRWLLNLRDAQENAGGSVPPCVPDCQCFGLPDDGGPAWADAALIVPWAMYRHYGETRFLSDAYPSMVGYMEFLAAHKVAGFIRPHPDKDSWGGFGDWLAPVGNDSTEGSTPKDFIGTAFYANNARILAETAATLGDRDGRDRWTRLRESVVSAFRERFVTRGGMLTCGSQTACVLALHFDLLEESMRPGVFQTLARDIRSRDNHLATGFVGTPYLLHVLERFGALDLAYTLLEQQTCPSWLFPVAHGATTVWERWNGWTPEDGFADKGMNSFNHYAYGAVGDWLVSTVAGLVPDAPGYSALRFKPRPGGSLTAAEARLRTPHGEAAVAWRMEDDSLSLDLKVPQGVSARLDLSDSWVCAHGTVLRPGRHRLRATRTR